MPPNKPSNSKTRRTLLGFTLVELLVVISVVAILATLSIGALSKIRKSTSLAVSANNIRQLSAGGVAYLADHNNTFWKYYERVNRPNERGINWWFGFEDNSSKSKPEGEREFDASKGPLAEYLPKSITPDPSLSMSGNAFKPKYKRGYIGAGYNTVLGGGWIGRNPLQNRLQLSNPSKVVVFFTSAQVNTFQRPASPSNPMLEEFYGIDEKEITAHFRHGGKAMVAFATGNVGFLEMDDSTRDKRYPEANVGRFAPVGSTEYLE